MLVLVTRALDEAMRTAASLAALGHTAILSPVLEIVPTGAEWPAGVVDGVLATSARGFEFFSASAGLARPRSAPPDAALRGRRTHAGEPPANAASRGAPRWRMTRGPSRGSS